MASQYLQNTGNFTGSQKRQTVFIIEDDPDIVELVQYNLEREGYSVESARDGETGLREVTMRQPSIVLLDLMMPGLDGLQLCRLLKQNDATKKIPIIMLTAKGEEADKVLGLGLGADDYVTKPFSPKELVARVQALLRRSEWSEKKETSPQEKVVVGSVCMDPQRYEVSVRGQQVTLTLSEFRLLRSLMSNPGRVLSRDQLLDRMTLGESVVIDRNIDVHIGAIRKKLGSEGDLISTVRGVGYKFKDVPRENA